MRFLACMIIAALLGAAAVAALHEGARLIETRAVTVAHAIDAQTR